MYARMYYLVQLTLRLTFPRQSTRYFFLARARAVSPMSVSAASEVDKLFPQGVAKGLKAIDLKRLNNLQSRSLRKQSLKTSIIARLNSLAAQGSEAYDMAYAIAELVRVGIQAHALLC